MLILDAYNKLANLTGFPAYTNATDTPDTTRFLLHILSDALLYTIDSIYISQNVLQRTNTITTKKGQELYVIDGIIKDIYILQSDGTPKRLPFAEGFDKNTVINTGDKDNQHEPVSYCITGGYLRLLPCPDREYTVKVIVSTTSLVWANNDTSRDTIESIDDSIMADTRFCNLVILKAACLLFARLQNANFAVYEDILDKRMRTYIEQDNGTMEAQRGLRRRGGHYNPRKGLLGD